MKIKIEQVDLNQNEMEWNETKWREQDDEELKKVNAFQFKISGKWDRVSLAHQQITIQIRKNKNNTFYVHHSQFRCIDSTL